MEDEMPSWITDEEDTPEMQIKNEYDYKILTASRYDPNALSRQVESYLNQGWKLAGSIAVSKSDLFQPIKRKRLEFLPMVPKQGA